MTIVDSVLAAVLLFILLIILGVMREAVTLRGEVRAVFQLLANPPASRLLGTRVPELLASTLLSQPSSHTGEFEHPMVVAFVTDGCPACERFVDEVGRAVAKSRIDPSRLSFVLSLSNEAATIASMARAIPGARFMLDRDGAILNACGVRGTPTQWAVWNRSLEVLDYRTGVDPSWTANMLEQTRPLSRTNSSQERESTPSGSPSSLNP
jgi:hypothetical protein